MSLWLIWRIILAIHIFAGAVHLYLTFHKYQAIEVKPFRLGVVSTYPPERCGIAEFTYDLFHNYFNTTVEVKIIALDSNSVPKTRIYDKNKVVHVVQGKLKDLVASRRNYADAARFINNNFDAVTLHHEFGIYGGDASSLVVEFMSELNVSIHLVLHYMPLSDRDNRYYVLESMLPYIDHLTVFVPEYCNYSIIRESNVSCEWIPHGMPADEFLDDGIPSTVIQRRSPEKNRTIITSGLLSTSKGLEHMIEAMRTVVQTHPDVEYLILGQPHPVIGFTYICQLEQSVRRANLLEHIRIEPVFHTKTELIRTMRDADIVVTPYTDLDQSSSSTLSMALGLGTPSISSNFRYARLVCDEFKPSPACLTVRAGSAMELAKAVSMLLSNASLATTLRKNSVQVTRGMSWPITAQRHVDAARKAWEIHWSSDRRTARKTPIPIRERIAARVREGQGRDSRKGDRFEYIPIPTAHH